MNEHDVILFFTTSSALRTEKLLKRAGLDAKLVPTPRQFSSDCGMSLRFNRHDRSAVEALLVEKSVEYEAVHELN